MTAAAHALAAGRLLTAPVLDAAASEDWVLSVLMLEAHWQPRHRTVPFFSLGLAAYLDAVDAAPRYHQAEARRCSNALLGARFMPLMATVAAALRRLLDAPMRLDGAAAALPGFHIYLPHPAFGGAVASVHRDLQFRAAFAAVEPEDGDVFSFTLPLCHPAVSGLRRWPGCTDAKRLTRAGGLPARPEFQAYRPGEIVVHDGLAPHQAVLGFDGRTPRISLQGHGWWAGDASLLYW